MKDKVTKKTRDILWSQVGLSILLFIAAIYVLVIYNVLPFPERTRVNNMNQEMLDRHEDVTLISFVAGGGYYSY